MRKLFLLTGLIFGVLLLSPPAFAVSYSGSAQLDLSTLTFSGIDVRVSPFFQYQQAFVSENVGANCCGGMTVNNTVDDRTGWSDRSVSAQLPLGLAVTTADQSLLSAAVTNIDIDAGQLNAQVWRRGILVANEAGDLTVSVRYALTNNGVPSSVSPHWSFSAGTSLNLGGLDDTRDRLNSGVGLETGTLSLTRWYNQGESTVIDLAAQTTGGSVPLPGMLWPTAALLIGAFVLARRKMA
jgi:hypothetical protein